ncbi:MAG TPA: protein phosphatase 2C domain-containing protein [Gammaproteobacteria bacterium]|nr:protein phosphatase 2C domain-containing protein [Gammaproteobacteria bacterium]
MSHWTSASVTEIGERNTNEDAFLEAPDLRLWAVADGLGGHHHGEVASATALHALKSTILDGQDLTAAVAAANHATWTEARKRGSDMGTTLVALRLHEATFELAWVGDSRGYRWQGEHLEALTTDHTEVQAWVAQGRLSADEARAHPYGHVLSRAIGMAAEVRPDRLEGPLTGDELFLLCTDGLTDTLNTARIAEVLGSHRPAALPTALCRAALAARNPYQDNLTAVAVWPR